MEFPGGSITNIRVIDGFSNIYWRIYTEDTSSINPPADGLQNGHTILKHISRLKELELRLRSLGCLVLSYPRRLGLLIFSATPDFEHISPLIPNDKRDDLNRLFVGSTALKVWTSGSVSSSDLTKSLRSDIIQATSANSPAASHRLQAGSVPPRRVDNSGGSAAIYASFISAVTAAFSLQIVRQNNAIPLGPRTLFNTVESELGEKQGILNDGPTSISALTSLQVQLTSNGKLTVALQSIAQIGLTRLSQPEGESLKVSNVPSGTDLWLAPNGSIARSVTKPSGNIDSPPSLSAAELEWKSNVRQWLSFFGLSIDFITDEGWVEVEVWEPFYAKLSGEASRPKMENSPLPLKRIIWPAAYCFTRTKSTLSVDFDGPGKTPVFDCDPLEFAENWCAKEIPNVVEKNSKQTSDQEGKAINQNTSSPRQPNLSEGIESLSRASLYADLQTASLVYPTPPDGTTGIGVNTTASTDIFGEDSDHGSSLFRSQNSQQQDVRVVGKDRLNSDVTMGFGPSAGLAVGSGLYDTNEDDDLFGDMNGRDFGTKGITDADFSFFDDPDFNPSGNDLAGNEMNIDDVEEVSDLVDTSKPDATQVPEFEVTSPSKTALDEFDASQSSPDKLATTPPEQSFPGVSAMVSSPHHNQIQTISPPLSPVEVKKLLFPEPVVGAQPVHKSAPAPSHYNPVTFRNNISSWDKKYGSDGKFAFMGAGTATNNDAHRSSNGIPTIGLPHRKSTVKIPTTFKSLDEKGSLSKETAQRSLSNSDSSSDTDDESDESEQENIQSMTAITLKRKRAPSFSASSVGPPSEQVIAISDQELTAMPKSDDAIFLGNFLSTFSDWSITGFFSLTENQVFSALTSKEMQVEIAQLLVDQVTQSSLDHKLDGKFGVSCLDNQAFCLQQLLEGTDFLGGFEKLDLNSFVTLQEQSVLSPPALNAPTPRQNAQRRDSGKGSIAKLPPPHLRVRRGKDYLETLPPAVSFWETFGLEPAHGPKDITGYCIHPHSATEAADAFLERLTLLYTGCNLGNHTRGGESSAFTNGLGGWDANSSMLTNYQTSIQQLKGICEELGTALLNGMSSKDSIVVYVINPFSHAASLVDICAAFWCLLQKYAVDADKQQTKQLNEAVLQIIPMDFVTSPESLVVPAQSDYLNLALEIYSRCSLKQPQGSLINSTPPVVLAEPIPPSIGFRLASERASPLQEGKCLHIACSRSQDQRWVSVAWSDNVGMVQRTMSYCLRYRDSAVSRHISTVRNEIWTATREILDRDQARWRIIMASTENVDQDEHDTWLNLAEQYNKTRPVPVELTMLTVNTTPDLFLSPPLPPIPMSVLNPQASSTPVATPLPSGAILSPDQLGNAPTPPGGGNIPANAPTPTDALFESDAEAMLTDICDESWGVVLSHRLNGTLHLTEYRPALASGYLVRRKGATDSDGAFTMNVNILYAQRPSLSYETLLREILGMYRDLATLARVRGTRIVQRGTLPWHIASAVRAQEVLSYVL